MSSPSTLSRPRGASRTSHTVSHNESASEYTYEQSLPRTVRSFSQLSQSLSGFGSYSRSPSVSLSLFSQNYAWACRAHNRRVAHDLALCYRQRDSRLASQLHAKLELAARYHWPHDPPIVFFDKSCIGLFSSAQSIRINKKAPKNGVSLANVVLYLITESSMLKMNAALQRVGEDRFLEDIEEGLILAADKAGPILIPILVGEYTKQQPQQRVDIKSGSKFKQIGTLLKNASRIMKKDKKELVQLDPYTQNLPRPVEIKPNQKDFSQILNSLFSFQAVHLDPLNLDTAVAQILDIYEKQVMPSAQKSKPKLTRLRRKELQAASHARSLLYPPAPPVYFSSRDTELSQIHSGISSNHVVVISGPPGYGKSTLAHKYIDIHAHLHSNIFSISFESLNSAYAGFHLIATAMQLKHTDRETTRKSVCEFLQANRYVLVIERTDDPDLVDEMFKGLYKFTGNVIITTQHHAVAERVASRLKPVDGVKTRVKMVKLAKWTIEQTYSFLSTRCPVVKSMDGHALKKLLSLIDGVPITAELVCANMTTRRARQFEFGGDKGTDDPVVDDMPGLEIVFKNSVASIPDPSIFRAAVMVLGLCSCVASTDIPREYLQVAVEERYTEVIKHLVNLSLLKTSGVGVSIHPLMQVLAYNLLGKSGFGNDDEDVQELWMGRSVRAMLMSFPEVGNDQSVAKSFEIHCIHVIGNSSFEFGNEYLECVVKLSDRLVSWLQYWKDFARAKQVLEHQLTIAKHVYGESDDFGTVLHNLGHVCLEMGELSLSAGYFSHALKVFENLEGRESEGASAAVNGLGLVAMEQGNFGVAVTCFKESVRVLKQRVGADEELDREVGVMMNNLGLAMSNCGEYENAMGVYEEARELFERVHCGKYNKDVAMTYTNLANLMHSIGDYEAAIKLHNESLEIKRDLYGVTEDPPAVDEKRKRLSKLSKLSVNTTQTEKKRRVYNTDIANHLSTLASVYSDSGDYHSAVKFFKEALETYEGAYGSRENAECGLALNNLGIAAYDHKDYENAKKYYEQALSVYIAVHGTRNHIDCAMAINNLGLVASDRGDKELAEGYFKEALETKIAVYGSIRHKDCASTLNNLGLVACDRRDFTNAQKYYEEAIDILIQVYGTENQEQIAMTKNNLANIKLDLNDLDGAEKLYRDALNIFVKVYGNEEHVYVITTKENIRIIEERKKLDNN